MLRLLRGCSHDRLSGSGRMDLAAPVTKLLNDVAKSVGNKPMVTTFFGILALLPSLRIVLDDVQQTLLLLVDCANGGTLDVPHLKALVGAIGTAIGAGLVAARDANKSTELSTLPLHAITSQTP